jgi:hypothetical protein
MSPFPTHQPWEAPDPVPVMRRELKLLLIESNMLRVEVEQLRVMREEGRTREASLSNFLAQVSESRDHWRGEAERLRALIDEVPPWSLLRQSIMDAFRAWRTRLTRVGTALSHSDGTANSAAHPHVIRA